MKKPAITTVVRAVRSRGVLGLQGSKTKRSGLHHTDYQGSISTMGKLDPNFSCVNTRHKIMMSNDNFMYIYCRSRQGCQGRGGEGEGRGGEGKGRGGEGSMLLYPPSEHTLRSDAASL